MSFTSPFIAWLGATYTVGRRCVIAEVGVKSGGVETTRYLSNLGYTSEPADTPSSVHYDGCISGGVQFTRRLDIRGSGGSVSSGDIEINNIDGSKDSWLGDIWAGRTITVYMGDAGDEARGIAKWPKSQFEVVFSGTIDDIAPKDRGYLSLRLRDIFGPLNSTMSTATVGGTGDNQNELLPIALGECFNVTPVLVDAATQTYAPHLNSQIERVIEARDSAVSVSYTAATANGRFSLTNARSGQITCDVQGAKIGGVWRNDVGGLVEWVATLLGDGNFITSGQISTAALTAFRAANPQPVGLYLSDRPNRLAVMQQLAASIGATVTQTYDGKLILVKVGFGTPVGSIGIYQMVEGSFKPIGRPTVQGAFRLDGQRNWTPQPQSAIAAAVTSAQLPIFGNEYVTISASDATVIADWYQNNTPEAIETLMVVESDITAETARLLALWSVERKIFSFDGFAECFQYEIGDTVTLTHPRFGLSGGVPAQIIGVIPSWLDSKVRLEVLV